MKRYFADAPSCMNEDADGEWVRYGEHISSSQARDAEIERLQDLLGDALDTLCMRAKPCSNCPEFGDDVAVVDGMDETVERFRDIDAANAWLAQRRLEMVTRIRNYASEFSQ